VTEPDFADLLPAAPLHQRLGIVVTHATPHQVVATMPVDGNEQPFGALHGGATVALAEGVGSIGSALYAGPGARVAGVEVNATHHRAVRNGSVTATAMPLHLGRSLATWAIEIVDDDGNLICTSRVTCSIRGASGATSPSTT
jgi:1,4-dihydroxy-2-naphthoyl-CoA hydrolase